MVRGQTVVVNWDRFDSLGIGSLLAQPWKSGPFRAAFQRMKRIGLQPWWSFPILKLKFSSRDIYHD
jgi:hypothetical protein